MRARQLAGIIVTSGVAIGDEFSAPQICDRVRVHFPGLAHSSVMNSVNNAIHELEEDGRVVCVRKRHSVRPALWRRIA